MAMLIERMKLLKQMDDLDEYFKCAELLLSRHSIAFRSKEETTVAIMYQTISDKVAKVRKMREFREDSTDIVMQIESIREPSAEDEYRLLREVLQFAKDKKRYRDMQKLCFMALTSKLLFENYGEFSTC